VPTPSRVLISSLMLVLAAAVAPSFAQESRAQLAPVVAIVTEPVFVKPPAGDVAAVYFKLKNGGPKPLVVVGASSPVSEQGMIHETSIVDGQSRMRMRDKVVVQPGQTVAFAQGGLHVMLSGFRYEVATGDRVTVTLQLEGGAKVMVNTVVRSITDK
jgi:periplasmic copper chaperone A